MKAVFFLLSFYVSFAYAQTDMTFIRHYGTSGSEYGMSLTVNNDNTIALVQTIFENGQEGMAVTKTDAHGEVIWSVPFKVRDLTIPKQIEKINNDYLVYGTTWSNGSSQYVLFLARISSAGSILWLREYSASNADLAAGLAIMDQNIYLAATADYNVSSLYPKVLLIKTDTDGNIENTRIYSSQYMLSCYSVAASSGKICLAGTTNAAGTGAPNFNNLAIIQTDTALQAEWTKIYGTTYDDDVYSVIAGTNEWLLTGRTYSIATGWDFNLIRIDRNGNVTASKFYNAGNDDAGRTLIRTDDGGYLIGGDVGTFDERNMAVIKLNPSLSTQWAKQYPVATLFTNYVFDIEKLNGDSGFVFTGDLRPTNAFRNAPIFRANSSGNIKCNTSALIVTEEFIQTDQLDTVVAVNIPVVTVTDVQPGILSINFITQSICDAFAARYTYTVRADCPKICFNFTDQSTNAQLWYWEFPGGDPSFYSGVQPPEVCYDSLETSTVRLIVFNGTDTLSYALDINVDDKQCDTIFIPNVITPNTDGLNDYFVIKNLPEDFHLKIFNRWGNRVFEADKPGYIWPKREDTISDGVYFFTLEIPGKQYKGTVEVISSD